MSSRRHVLKLSGGVLVSFLLIAPLTSLAQQRPDISGTTSTAAKRDAMLEREADLEYRAVRLRVLSEGGKTRTPESPDDRKRIVSEIFKDFEHIQIINREMIQASSSLDRSAYKRISSLADEMNKRAKRLKTNLGIPDVPGEKKDTEPILTDAPQLTASLVTLNGSVKSFVANPLFKDPRVAQVQHLINLRRDISNIIDLSHAVKKVAVQLQH
jgi:hypothetical protein